MEGFEELFNFNLRKEGKEEFYHCATSEFEKGMYDKKI
jgi:hypothetical protein